MTPYFSGDGIDISACVNNAYGQDHFYIVAGLHDLYRQQNVLTYHGRRAFKDMALSLLPY